jgi:hypothetical protein
MKIGQDSLNLLEYKAIFGREVIRFVECLHPVATTTPAGLPGWGPRSAPGSVIECHSRITKFSNLFTASTAPRFCS